MAQANYDEFATTLKRNQMRSTTLRRQIFNFLAESNEPQSIQKIIQAVDDSHFVSVYRSLDALTRIGVLKRVPIGLKYKYELSESFKPHHHHVTCEQCGMSISIESSEVEDLMERITLEAGLRPTKHHFEAYGVCSSH